MAYTIESVKHFTFGVFVMIADGAGGVNELTFKYLQEAHDYINALNKFVA